MPVAVPNVGSHVRVTTMYPNTYAYRGKYDNYVKMTREGIVIKSIFKDPFYFAVETGAPDHPVSEYNAKSQHVIKIEYATGGATNVETSNKAWKVKSGDSIYLVQRMNGKYSCTCKGFEFRRECKHIAAAAMNEKFK